MTRKTRKAERDILALALAASFGLASSASASASLVPLKGPRDLVSPGRVAVFTYDGPALPGLTLAGLRQEAGFYHVSKGPWVALVAIPLDEKPGLKALHLSWDGGIHGQWTNLQVGPDPYPNQRRLKVPKLRKKLKAAAAAREKETLEKVETEALGGAPLWHGGFRWPLDGPIVVTSPFGASRSYNRGEAAWRHRGVDLRAMEKTPVLAPNDGVVLLARRRLNATGGTIVLGHGYGLSTSYFHLSKVQVKKGDTVKKGQLLGLSGSTGLANGPHLHWEMQLRGVPIQAQQWVPEDSGTP